ncbi:threonine-phosphate decarboxylase CobD [Ferribacterium limneticum]|uniref:threonine-phosphate decarboxylase CobD n=1 Tax=Ferribacterium limneticum TaxID=76259 RepID=UPI001CFC1319|nr:threonine-phosphate decarboxylase CobD [Ferribacterium limneticum]UCV28680.1 threonine-phosphate decarboxylase [Ferribacterium limneticum]UCV32597.1 threonine-phosphate decarboxylase [Ferribacterium limneticum]
MLEHGGRLREAAAHYNIPLDNWLDLSTGINPDPWPVPALPPAVWQRLPESNDGLEAAAAAYYGNANLLPVAGSQAAIQWLPTLLPRAVVACISPIYAEHPQAWQHAGHKIRFLQNALLPRALAAATPYVLLCNPNNPTADRHPHDIVLDAARQIKKRGGWLIVDEAFIDATPEDSVTPLAGSEEAPNLIVLRSIGKFFGLAGIRVGFVFGAPELLGRMSEAQGPWTISGPSREAAKLALQDTAWQAATRPRLQAAGERLLLMLAPLGEVKATALFATLTTQHAGDLHEALARQGILTRRFDQQPLLRFGLPGSETEWQRLGQALAEWKPA